MNFTKQCCCLLVGLVLLCSKSNAQNLFANPGFESINNCVEFKADCAPEAWFNIPASNFLVNSRVAPRPLLGHMVLVIPLGSVLANFNKPRFVYTRLCCPMIAGEKYTLSFYINTAALQFPSLSFYFTQKEPMLLNVNSLLQTPSITINKENVDGDYKDWQHVKVDYTATGNEKFCTITNYGLPALEFGMNTAMNKSGDVLCFIDEIILQPQVPGKICESYDANVKKMFDYNYRHTNNIPVFAEEPEKKPEVKFKNDTLVLSDLLFDINKAAVKPIVKDILDSLVTSLNNKKFIKIEISGHTDNTGNEKNNQLLSEARAAAVKDYLIIKMPSAAAKIISSGKGQTMPVAANTTAAGKQKNRRVEIVITYFNIVN